MASRSLGTLTIDMIANLGGWRDGLSKAERDAQKSAGSINKAFATIQGAITGLVAALSVDAFVNWIGGAMEWADAAQESAAASGVLTNEFLKLSGAASIMAANGADIQKALVALNTQIVKNDESLTNLGVSTRNADGSLRSAYDVFLDVADAVSKMEDGAKKTGVAVDIFGKKIGPDLVPMLNAGRDGITEVTDAVADLPPALAKAQGEWETNSFMMGEAFKGLRNTIAEAVMPVVNDFYEWALKIGPALKPLGEALSTLGTAAGVIVVGALKGLATLFTLIASGAMTAAHAITGLVNVAIGLGTLDADAMAAAIDKMGADILATGTSTKEALAALWDLNQKGTKESAKGAADALADIDTARINKYVESLKTLREKEQDNYAERLADAKHFAESKGLSDKETNALIEREYADHLQRLADIDKKGAAKPDKPKKSDISIEAINTGIIPTDAFGDSLDTRNAMVAAADQFLADQTKAAADARLDIWRTANETELQQLGEKYVAEQQLFKDALDAKALSQEEYDALSLESRAVYEQGVADIQAAAEAKLAADRQKTLNGAQTALGSISTLMNSHSRKLFEVGKVAAIANAGISMYEGVMKAWALGPILGPILAPLVALAGAANIASIKATKFGGGGGGSPAVGGGSSTTAALNAASTPAIPAVSTGPMLPPLDINLIGGGRMSVEEVADLMNKVGARLADNGGRMGVVRVLTA